MHDFAMVTPVYPTKRENTKLDEFFRCVYSYTCY